MRVLNKAILSYDSRRTPITQNSRRPLDGRDVEKQLNRMRWNLIIDRAAKAISNAIEKMEI